jgi:hypothetical protein
MYSRLITILILFIKIMLFVEVRFRIIRTGYNLAQKTRKKNFAHVSSIKKKSWRSLRNTK